MKIKDRRVGTILVVIGILFFCGCMGGGPTETTTSITSSGGETTTTTTPSGGISLEDILKLGKPSGYTVVYDITVSSLGETNRMTQTQYMMEGRFRFDMAGAVEGEMDEMRVYTLPEGTYICTEIQGTWNCLGGETREDVEYGFDLEDITSEIEGDLNQPTYDGTQLIAGVSAQCFKVTVSEGTTRYCVHPNYNMPLLVESTETSMGQEGYFKMIATSFKIGTLSDSVFELPAEPMDLNAICRQACMQMPAEYREDCLVNC